MGSVSGRLSPEERTRTPTEEIVARIWAKELRLPYIGLDDDFIDLGSHSLQGVAISARLEERFGVSIPVRILFEEPTVADLAAWIDRQRGGPLSAEVEIIRLQEGSGLRPIFAVPGGRAASRTLFALAKLARETDPRRPVYAFPGDPPVLANTSEESWVQAAAATLNAAVRTHQCNGPYLLLGSCVGGIIAWEMARQLEASGESVHLFLVDTKHPRLRTDAELPALPQKGTRRPSRKGINRGVLRRILGVTSAPGDVVTARVIADNRMRRSASKRAARRARKVASARADVTESAHEMPEDSSLRLERTRMYRPEPLANRVRLITNADWRRSHPTLGWDALISDPHEVAVMGKDHGLLRNVHEAAAWLRAQLDEVDPSSQRLAPE
jgi:thioesterase domain-containing protein/acyl carrier protein